MFVEQIKHLKTQSLLIIRSDFMTNARRKPSFARWMSKSYVRLGESWRRPRGRHSKVHRKEKGKIAMPSVGWGAPKNLRGLHPSGLREVVVSSVKDLGKIDVKNHAVKISHTVGKRKRAGILKKAEEIKIKVLNP